MSKICTKCKKTKSGDCFSKDRSASNGFSRWCRLCRKEHNKTLTYEPAMEGSKSCSKCSEIKSVLEFHRAKCKRDGRSSQCKSCRDEGPRRVGVRNIESKIRRTLPPEDRRFRVSLAASKTGAKRRGGVPCSATVAEIKAAFNGHCAICDVPEIECNQKLHLDHDHETGNFRGWLCYHCNNILGRAKDSEEILINALHYLMNCKERV